MFFGLPEVRTGDKRSTKMPFFGIVVGRPKIHANEVQDFWDSEERCLPWWVTHGGGKQFGVEKMVGELPGVGGLGWFRWKHRFFKCFGCWEKESENWGVWMGVIWRLFFCGFCACILVDSVDSAGSKNAANNHLTGWPSRVQTWYSHFCKSHRGSFLHHFLASLNLVFFLEVVPLQIRPSGSLILGFFAIGLSHLRFPTAQQSWPSATRRKWRWCQRLESSNAPVAADTAVSLRFWFDLFETPEVQGKANLILGIRKSPWTWCFFQFLSRIDFPKALQELFWLIHDVMCLDLHDLRHHSQMKL